MKFFNISPCFTNGLIPSVMYAFIPGTAGGGGGGCGGGGGTQI